MLALWLGNTSLLMGGKADLITLLDHLNYILNTFLDVYLTFQVLIDLGSIFYEKFNNDIFYGNARNDRGLW